MVSLGDDVSVSVFDGHGLVNRSGNCVNVEQASAFWVSVHGVVLTNAEVVNLFIVGGAAFDAIVAMRWPRRYVSTWGNYLTDVDLVSSLE
jgi:hypothetical protein